MDGLPEELDRRTHRLLRQAVLEYAAGEPRRRHPPRVHVGLPGGPSAVFTAPVGAGLDAALRTDVIAAMDHRVRPRLPVGGAEDPLVWLARTGPLDETQDADLDWLAAAWAAYAEAGRALTYVVVNRHGWRDPRSGTLRTWARLRPRR